jgi:hypothetical protein
MLRPALDQLQALALRGAAQARRNPVQPARSLLAGYLPGILVCVVIALAATFLQEHYGGPQLLYALLIGLSLHFLMENPRITRGINFCAKNVLRAAGRRRRRQAARPGARVPGGFRGLRDIGECRGFSRAVDPRSHRCVARLPGRCHCCGRRENQFRGSGKTGLAAGADAGGRNNTYCRTGDACHPGVRAGFLGADSKTRPGGYLPAAT